MTEPILLVNAGSGRARTRGRAVEQAARAIGVDVRVVEPGGDLTAVARAAAAEAPPVLGVAGGDGSLAPVATAAVEHDLPFVIVPLGSRNHFARDAGLDRRRPLDALAVFEGGEERRVDVGRVRDSVFLNNVSLGIYAAMVHEPQYRRHKIVVACSRVPAHFGRSSEPLALEFDAPSGLPPEARIVVVANNAYELEGAPVTGVRQRLDEGLLQVCAVRSRSALALAAVVARVAAGRREVARDLSCWACRSFDVESHLELIPAAVDGEPRRLEAPLRFESVPGALRLRVPRRPR